MTIKNYLKFEGHLHQLKTIFSIPFGIVFIIAGILLWAITKQLGYLIISLGGIIGILIGIVHWYRAKHLLKGRFW